MSPLPNRFFVVYYAATVGFVLLDYVFGVNLRLAFLEDFPRWRLTYYDGCGVFLVLVLRFPESAALVAAVESLANLVGLILETGVKVVAPSVALVERGEGVISVAELVNFLLSGSVAYLSWHSRSRDFWRETRQ